MVGVNAEAAQQMVVEFIGNVFVSDAGQVSSEAVGFEQNLSGPACHTCLLKDAIGHCVASAAVIDQLVHGSEQFSGPDGDGMGLFGVLCNDSVDSPSDALNDCRVEIWRQGWQILAVSDLRNEIVNEEFQVDCDYFLQWPGQQAQRKQRRTSSFQVRVHKTTADSNCCAAT